MTNYEKVITFNLAIGNKSGDKRKIDWDLLTREVDMIQSEVDELREAIELKNINKFRDGLCDVHVFAYGTHHKIGHNADKDMDAVMTALYSRFCENIDILYKTIAFHKNKGVLEVTIHGKFPFAYIKSDGDYPDAPKGKFLKSINYHEPVFPD